MNMFKRKLPTEEYVNSLLTLSRNISVDLANDREALSALGFAEIKNTTVLLYCFQYIMYRTNLVLWSKFTDELLYAEISKLYYEKCEDYISSFLYQNSDQEKHNIYSRKKLFLEFHKLLENNYDERLKVMNSQICLIYYHIKGEAPSYEQKSNLLALAIEIEDSIIELIDSLF